MSLISRFWNWFKKNSDRSKNIHAIEEIFGIQVKDPTLYHLSLIHRSSTGKGDNERLELLGDAVLDLVVVDHLYRCFPELDEGKLTKLKSKIVSREHLSALAIRIGLTERLTLMKQKEISPELLIGNVFEAIFGAMYLEQGFDTARRKALEIIEKEVHLEGLLVNLVDSKSLLLEIAQKNRWNITFHVREEPKDAEHKFMAKVKKNNIVIGEGRGNSKKKAEKEASAHALQTLQKEEADSVQ